MKSLFNFAIVLFVSTALFTLFFFLTLPSFASLDNGILINGIPTIIIMAGGYLIWRYDRKGYTKLPLTSPIALLGCLILLFGGILIYLGLSTLISYVEANPTHVGPVSWDDDSVRITYYQVISGSIMLLEVALSPYSIAMPRSKQLIS